MDHVCLWSWHLKVLGLLIEWWKLTPLRLWAGWLYIPWCLTQISIQPALSCGLKLSFGCLHSCEFQQWPFEGRRIDRSRAWLERSLSSRCLEVLYFAEPGWKRRETPSVAKELRTWARSRTLTGSCFFRSYPVTLHPRASIVPSRIPPPWLTTTSFLFPNFWNKLLHNFISLSRSQKPLSFAIQENPPSLLGGGGCLIVTRNFALGNDERIYRSSKSGPYNNRRGMVFEVYALINFCWLLLGSCQALNTTFILQSNENTSARCLITWFNRRQLWVTVSAPSPHLGGIPRVGFSLQGGVTSAAHLVPTGRRKSGNRCVELCSPKNYGKSQGYGENWLVGKVIKGKSK